MLEHLEAWWQPISTVLALLIALLASGHVVLHKRDVRSATAWVGLIWLVPALGAVLYMLLGVNRIRRSAVRRREGMQRYNRGTAVERISISGLDQRLSHAGVHLVDLAEMLGRVTNRPLLGGNRITPLHDGDEAYPAMLEAIDNAQRSIALTTYIFDTSSVGMRFISALARARDRGVQVRVLIDDVGSRYAYPPADRELRRRSVKAARFMPALPLWRAAYFNLRNHRKILVVDGRLGFTGGINIRAGHVLADAPRHPVRDLHFRIEGPVVSHLTEVFAEDWQYTSGERLDGEAWFPALQPVGPTLARAIPDGPDEDIDRFSWALHGALACARRRVVVVTPYFLPDGSLLHALSVAALRGVDVCVFVPEKGNLRLVQWAMWGQMREVLGQGVRVRLSPAPFDHTKLVIVDDEWVLLGSANWDSRSLRLNFELEIECYDVQLAKGLHAALAARMKNARELTRDQITQRAMVWRLRDGFARLLLPYL